MFSKISRYRQLPDTVVLDAAGRRLKSRSLRLTPAVSGRLVHVLEQGERLDQLAQEYYEQPRHWWRICDANPEHLSPWELTGSAPRTTVVIELSRPGSDPPWPALLAALRRAPGVESAVFGSAEQPFPELDEAGGEPAWRWCLILVFNDLSTKLEELLEAVAAAEFAAAAPRTLGRVGKPVVIPPRVVPSHTD